MIIIIGNYIFTKKMIWISCYWMSNYEYKNNMLDNLVDLAEFNLIKTNLYIFSFYSYWFRGVLSLFPSVFSKQPLTILIHLRNCHFICSSIMLSNLSDFHIFFNFPELSRFFSKFWIFSGVSNTPIAVYTSQFALAISINYSNNCCPPTVFL